MSVVLAIVLALAGSYLLTPLVERLATRLGVIDHPDERRVHDRPTPRWGGIAIYIAFVVAVVVAVLLDERVRFDSQIMGVLLGGTVVAIVGLIDDKYGLSPVVQVAGIIAGGMVLITFGGKIAYISNPFGPGILPFGSLAIPVTLVWIFGVTKTVDLMDGLDGLAAGICAIASATLLLMSFQALSGVPAVDVAGPVRHAELVRSFTTVVILSGALLGASLGFLRFNYPPARIFMGTIGAQFMGFVIASASVIGAFKVAALVAMAVPVLVLGVPILDAAWVVLRRVTGGRRVYEADKSHVHHRLLERGLSHGQTIWIIYLMTALLSALGLALFWYVK